MREQSNLHLPPIWRHADNRLESLRDWSSANKTALARVYIAALFLFGVIYQLANPIVAGDTDMWYHLSGGQHFWNTGEVPNTTFFSFIEPERVWTNYFWGFQALIFKLHELGGYQALVAFRALMFFCLIGVIALFLFHDNAWKIRPAPILLLFVLFFLLMDGRSHQVRPHLVSYLFIATFLYILEHKPRWTSTLPVLTVFWINTHGIEYVVGTLICGAYFLEAVILRYVLKRRLEDRNLIFLLSLAACAFTVLFNPHGPTVLLTPFVIPDQIGRFIYELQPLSQEILNPTAATSSLIVAKMSFVILFVMALIAWFATLFRGNGRISHILLALGGVFLLTKGLRFIWEWALLSLPLLSSFACSLAERGQFHRSLIKSALSLALLCIPFFTIANTLDKHSSYPFDSRDLPAGIVQFLASRGLTGNLITEPTQAGYVQWKLNPGILIYSNMQLPPFDSPTLFKVLNAYRDANSLQTLISKYEIHFISVRRENNDFPRAISAFPQFKPVFFDDQQILYANNPFFPQLIDEFQLQSVDPFNLYTERREPNRQIQELKRIHTEFPEGEHVNHALVRLLFWKHDYSSALKYARTLAAHHPRNPYGYFWTGHILEKTARCKEAIPYFETATEYASVDLAVRLNTRIGNCYFVLKDFSRAHEFLSKGVNPMLYPAASEDLYLLAVSASLVGKDREAISALEMLLSQKGTDETELRTNAERFLSEIRSDALESTPGFSNWLRHLLDT